jgi:hypothetical protein
MFLVTYFYKSAPMSGKPIKSFKLLTPEYSCQAGHSLYVFKMKSNVDIRERYVVALDFRVFLSHGKSQTRTKNFPLGWGLPWSSVASSVYQDIPIYRTGQEE